MQQHLQPVNLTPRQDLQSRPSNIRTLYEGKHKYLRESLILLPKYIYGHIFLSRVVFLTVAKLIKRNQDLTYNFI
ncbi:unnamed protein product [Meloidogyne enterolobii]|uniref:Uncharacterized protein n=1 Tax=Meloidogyne enterolobii TaxID=390850 RepID=A0ACB1ASL8_MELEN